MKVILAGPPQSGKSVLREALKRAVQSIPGAPYPYILTACPDGEGAWYQETVRNHPPLAAQLKAEYKAKLDWPFTYRVAADVDRCQEPLTIIDIGGRIDDKNELIASHATHAVLIAGQVENIEPWRAFCNRLNLHIIAELHSHYVAAEDCIEESDSSGVLRGSVHHLERGEDASGRPVVVKLAAILVSLAVSRS